MFIDNLSWNARKTKTTKKIIVSLPICLFVILSVLGFWKTIIRQKQLNNNKYTCLNFFRSLKCGQLVFLNIQASLRSLFSCILFAALTHFPHHQYAYMSRLITQLISVIHKYPLESIYDFHKSSINTSLVLLAVY